MAIDQQTLQSKKNLVVTLGVEERRRALRGDPAEASEVDAARPNAPRRLADATGVEPRRLADAAPRPELRANFGDVPFPGALSSPPPGREPKLHDARASEFPVRAVGVSAAATPRTRRLCLKLHGVSTSWPRRRCDQAPNESPA